MEIEHPKYKIQNRWATEATYVPAVALTPSIDCIEHIMLPCQIYKELGIWTSIQTVAYQGNQVIDTGPRDLDCIGFAILHKDKDKMKIVEKAE